jgi:hypothetical protein
MKRNFLSLASLIKGGKLRQKKSRKKALRKKEKLRKNRK